MIEMSGCGSAADMSKYDEAAAAMNAAIATALGGLHSLTVDTEPNSAQNATEKAAAMAALSRLTQDMMRRATWRQLQSHQLVKVIEQVFKAVGVRLTHRKLGQAVPVLGVAINGGMNVKFFNDAHERAQEAYRLRFLTEKYDLDPGEWAPAADGTVGPSEDDGGLPLIDEVIAGQIEE